MPRKITPTKPLSESATPSARTFQDPLSKLSLTFLPVTKGPCWPRWPCSQSQLQFKPISWRFSFTGKECTFLRRGVQEAFDLLFPHFVSFLFHSINDESCGKKGDVDHGVLAVGYGTDLETQTPYWLVKNSWGESWGDAGYVKLARNSTNEWGMCAILKMSSFPVVE